MMPNGVSSIEEALELFS